MSSVTFPVSSAYFSLWWSVSWSYFQQWLTKSRPCCLCSVLSRFHINQFVVQKHELRLVLYYANLTERFFPFCFYSFSSLIRLARLMYLRTLLSIFMWSIRYSTWKSIFSWILVQYYKNFHGLSPRANYTDRATTACQRSDCQLLWIEGAMWSTWRIPMPYSRFSGQEQLLFYQVAPQLYSRGWVDPVPDPLLFFW
jgi:hypothetical protein